MKRGVYFSAVAVAVGALLCVAGAAAQWMKDAQIASRPLTDADMEKYIAITAKVTQANKERGQNTSSGAFAEMMEKKKEACEEQGWFPLDYDVVGARVTVALQHIAMEKNTPVPAKKKADVALARKYKDRIAAAKK